MTTDPNDPAFNPRFDANQEMRISLTKREHFASIMMQGYLTQKTNFSEQELVDKSILLADLLITGLNR